MIRTVSISSPRSVKATTTMRPRLVRPRRRRRSSPTEWAGSGTVTDRSSSNAVVASSKLSRCLRRLRRALSGSHSNRRAIRSGHVRWMCIRLTPEVKLRAPASTGSKCRREDTGCGRDTGCSERSAASTHVSRPVHRTPRSCRSRTRGSRPPRRRRVLDGAIRRGPTKAGRRA